jgi:hypothetical protein
MPAASIQFSQGATTTTTGQSALGYALSTQVNFTDTAGAGATWAWSIVGFPGPLGTAPVVNNSTTQTADISAGSLTVDGVYIIKLVRTDPGPVVTTQVRFFAIGDADYSTVLPSAGQTGAMTNIGGSAAAQQAGWEGRADASTNVFLDAILRFVRSRIGRFVGLQQTINFVSAGVVTTSVTDAVDKPWRVINMTGAGVYTEELVTTGSPPQGKSFKYRINMTTGAGNFVLKSGVGGTTLFTLTSPSSGTFSYAFEVAFDGAAWQRTYFSMIDPAAIGHTATLDGVAGLQTTSQTVATRIGSLRVDPSKYPSNAQITFQVAIDTTAPLATIQLYNLTDSGIVAGTVQTTLSLGTVILTSGSLTLPNSAKDYEVQMFMAPGGTSDHVDCTSARILLNWA